MTTRIEWADETWNPMTGCTPVSEACEHCYAERMARRFKPCATCEENWRDECDVCDPEYYFAPIFHPDRLDKPLHWKKPRRIFVNSMSDLFHEAFTDEQIRDVIDVAIRAPQHTHIVLTKRPERMASVMAWYCDQTRDAPLPNLWLGVTAETQQRADERIPILIDTPAAVRFVSLEPLLGPVDLRSVVFYDGDHLGHTLRNLGYDTGLDWVIIGGETGPGARPMQPEWALDVYRQCKAAWVPFFWKQAGKWLSSGEHFSAWASEHAFDASDPIGEWSRMVATREFPAVAS